MATKRVKSLREVLFPGPDQEEESYSGKEPYPWPKGSQVRIGGRPPSRAGGPYQFGGLSDYHKRQINKPANKLTNKSIQDLRDQNMQLMKGAMGPEDISGESIRRQRIPDPWERTGMDIRKGLSTMPEAAVEFAKIPLRPLGVMAGPAKGLYKGFTRPTDKQPIEHDVPTKEEFESGLREDETPVAPEDTGARPTSWEHYKAAYNAANEWRTGGGPQGWNPFQLMPNQEPLKTEKELREDYNKYLADFVQNQPQIRRPGYDYPIKYDLGTQTVSSEGLSPRQFRALRATALADQEKLYDERYRQYPVSTTRTTEERTTTPEGVVSEKKDIYEARDRPYDAGGQKTSQYSKYIDNLLSAIKGGEVRVQTGAETDADGNKRMAFVMYNDVTGRAFRPPMEFTDWKNVFVTPEIEAQFSEDEIEAEYKRYAQQAWADYSRPRLY